MAYYDGHGTGSASRSGVVCVGSRILDWDGECVDFISSGVCFIGFGYQTYHNLPVRAVSTIGEHEALFACGGAMLVDRAIFLEIGGFDEDFFAYYEDVDFGWRLWLMGYRVLITPDALNLSSAPRRLGPHAQGSAHKAL